MNGLAADFWQLHREFCYMALVWLLCKRVCRQVCSLVRLASWLLSTSIGISCGAFSYGEVTGAKKGLPTNFPEWVLLGRGERLMHLANTQLKGNMAAGWY